MKIESMRTRPYRSFKVDDADLPVAVRERMLALRRFDELRTAGCAERWARRWKYGDKAERPGQLVQIDHMTFSATADHQGVSRRRPQWNGRVERANRTARIEFWNFLDCDFTVEAVSGKLVKYEFFYSYEHPHSALD